jgi:vancomycin resistance protein YoaR
MTGLVMVVAMAGIVFEIRYWNLIYPGVKIGEIGVGGLSVQQAAMKINIKAGGVKQIILRWGVNEWTLQSADIGLNYDSMKTTAEALNAGRTGKLSSDIKVKWLAARGAFKINPIWSWNENGLEQSLATVAAEIDIPAQEPEITIDKNSVSVSVTPGENGQQVDQKLLIEKISQSIVGWGERKIDIPVIEIKPKLTDQQVNDVRNKANVLLGKKLFIKNPESGQVWEVDDDQILTWLDLQTGGWKKPEIENWVSQLAQTVNRDPENASFRFVGVGRVEEFKPAKDGIIVLEENTTDSIIGALNILGQNVSQQNIDLTIRDTQPEIATGDVNNLGIKELIGKGESWFVGSITNRIFNLKKAADLLNGILVPPGEIFSFNKAVGEVSQNTGFKQAYIIKEGKTVLGDGGGVCQVSTTLFRAALAAGLPIEERTAHAYRVSYYEVKYQPGFDATVFQPDPDFQFRNDTSAYILIQTVYDEKSKYLSFELYGTSDGRKVDISKARIWDVTPPPPDLYQDDPTLPTGQVVQTEHAAWGAKVAFDWKVTRSNEVLQQKTFFSDYKPWQAVYLRGTKIN